jgi:hypothetical protein
MSSNSPRSVTAYIESVRALAVIGALLFAYLAVIPAALVGATLHPACEGSCGYAAPLSAYLVLAFVASSAALAASAVCLAAFAVRPSSKTTGLVGRSLQISAAVIGVLLFSEFAIAYPVPAVVIAAVSAPVVWLITRRRLAAG